MIHSMTGFGDAHANDNHSRYSVEIKSLNNRYFKPTLRLPDELAGLEPEVESLLRRSVGRGSVLLTLKMRAADDALAHRINTDVLTQYLGQLRQAGLDDIAIGQLLQLPGVVIDPSEAQSGDEAVAQHRESVLALVEKAVDHLIASRRKEGESLAGDLLLHINKIRGYLGNIADRAAGVVDRYHQRIQTRVNELLARAQLEIGRDELLKEVAVYADRSDISEEIHRLGHHLDVFEQTCNSRDEHVGRRLDFIAQEMLREANTIGSKAGDTEIATNIVEIKTCIDRIKEQVQNVE